MAEQADGSIIVDAELNSEGFKADSNDLKRAVKSLNKKVESLGPTFQKAITGSSSAVATFQSKAETLENTISELETKMEFLSNQHTPTEEYIKLGDEIKETEKLLKHLQIQREKSENSGILLKFNSFATAIQNCEDKIRQCRSEMSKLVASGNAFQMGSDTDEYRQYTEAIQKLSEMQEQISKAESEESDRLQEIADNATTSSEYVQDLMSDIERLKDELRTMEAAGVGFGYEEYDRAYAELQKNEAELKEYKAGLTEAKEETSRFGTVMSKVKGIAKGFGNIMKGAFKGFGKVVKGAAFKIASFHKETSGAGRATNSLIKKVAGLGSMLKRLVIRKLLNSIVTGVKEGMQNLSQFSSSVNADMSALVSSLTLLKNSFAAAFAPVLSIVTPVLTQLIHMLATAVNYIGMFFAALKGSKTFTKAVAVQQDYAKSLNGTAGAAKEAKRQLAGFDELNILSDSSSSGGGGSASPNVGEMFEEVGIDSEVKSFVDSLKMAFKNGDYAEIGIIIGKKINSIFKRINKYIRWDNVGKTISKYILAFSIAFNALIYTVDWERIGDTFAQGINTFIHTIFLLLTTINWDSIGRAIAKGLNGLVHGIDWKLLGTTLGAYITAWIDSIYGFIAEFDWSGLGDNISDFINNAFASVNWAKIGVGLTNFAIGLLDSLRSAIKGADWYRIGTDVSECLNNIDWIAVVANLSGVLSDLAIGFFDLFIGAIETLDWHKLGKDLWNSLVALIQNIDWGSLQSKFWELLGSIVGGSYALAASFWQNVWKSLESAYNDTLSYFKDFIKNAGGDIAQGMLDGISNTLSDLGTWIKTHIFDPFINGFKNAFGIHSPAKEMEPMGNFIIQGLLQGITNAWGSITEFFSSALSSLGSTISGAWEKYKCRGFCCMEWNYNDGFRHLGWFKNYCF